MHLIVSTAQRSGKQHARVWSFSRVKAFGIGFLFAIVDFYLEVPLCIKLLFDSQLFSRSSDVCVNVPFVFVLRKEFFSLRAIYGT